MKKGNEYLTCDEIAAKYRVSLITVWRWIRRGDLLAVKIHKNYRVKASDLDAFERDHLSYRIK